MVNALKNMMIGIMQPYNFEILMGDPIEFEFAKLSESIYQTDVTFHLVDELGNLVFVGSTALDIAQNEIGRSRLAVTCTIPPDLGVYTISRLLFVKEWGTVLFEYPNALSFQVINGGNNHFGWTGRGISKEGVVHPKLTWKVNNKTIL